MEIQYLWIDNFRSIEKQGFNFGSKFIFDFNHGTSELSCIENEQYVADFFGKTTSNVTAFIGANGSGKSTILDFIKLNISVDIGTTNLSYICLYKERGRNEIFVYNTVTKDLKLPFGKESLFKNAKNGRIDGSLTSLLFPTAFIFYSTAIDYNTDKEFCPIDLSTSSMLKSSNYLTNKYDESLIQGLARNEMKLQFRFASKYKGLLPFPLPEELHANPNNYEENEITHLINLKTSLSSKLKACKRIIQKELHDKRGLPEDCTIEIYESLFWHSIQYLLKNAKVKYIAAAIDTKSIAKSSNPTLSLLKRLYKSGHLNLPTWSQTENFFKQLRKLEQEKIMYYFFARFNFNLRPNGNFKKIDAFINSYNKIELIVGDFLRFNWSGLSTGEQSFFSLFSRFYSARTKVKNYLKDINSYRVGVKIHNLPHYKKQPDVVVMIDEGEVHLHPQWQKEFIYNLIYFLPEVMQVPKVQLILTSNSPFLISDLPNYNVVFLKSENNKTTINSNIPVSFAANIHELLANSFFLDVPIGKLAEQKINEVIKLLNQKRKLTSERIEYINRFINLIDDSIVQNKLLQLLALKIKSNNWEEYALKQQRIIIDKKLSRISKNN